jgi:hypothetical protein
MFVQDGILRHYITLGADRGKLVLGIPLYGQSFTMKGLYDFYYQSFGTQKEGDRGPLSIQSFLL